jgi:hypothetical protein
VGQSIGRDQIYEAIDAERFRQETLKLEGKFKYTCAYKLVPECKLAILAEEFGEVARAVCENDNANLCEELVQVAAVCVAWLESL